jgi:hypothetical protein
MPKEVTKPRAVTTLSELMSPAALKLLEASGGEFVRQIGMDVVRGVVLDVLTGRNLRESTVDCPIWQRIFFPASV